MSGTKTTLAAALRTGDRRLDPERIRSRSATRPEASGLLLDHCAAGSLEGSGRERNVGSTGDLLSRDEVRHSGTGLQRMVRSRAVIACPGDRGSRRLWPPRSFERCDRLEQLVADLHAARSAT